jgi:GNAT superfamily N-acetyltransferase
VALVDVVSEDDDESPHPARAVADTHAARTAIHVRIAASCQPDDMTSDITYGWRTPISDDEVVALTESYGGRSERGWWDRIRPHSLGWVTARDAEHAAVGFANVAWDGGDHAFLLDPKVRGDLQRHGIGTALVGIAIAQAKQAGCEWLHVDFGDELAAFYFDACGFRSTPAGLIHLPDAAGTSPADQ